MYAYTNNMIRQSKTCITKMFENYLNLLAVQGGELFLLPVIL